MPALDAVAVSWDQPNCVVCVSARSALHVFRGWDGYQSKGDARLDWARALS